MAEINLYRCKRCGWSIEAPKDDIAILMEGAYALYMCPRCKKIVHHYQDNDPVFPSHPKCDCGEKMFTWLPSDEYCPECGGELEDLGLHYIED